MSRETPLYKDIRYIRRWADERQKNCIEIPFPKGKMFSILRDSDIEDRRKVVALRVDAEEDRLYGAYKIYYGIEDAIRTLYREGCMIYTCATQIRMIYPSGLTYEFHRLEFIGETTLDKIAIDTYLRVVRVNRATIKQCKIDIRWSDRNGEHRY